MIEDRLASDLARMDSLTERLDDLNNEFGTAPETAALMKEGGVLAKKVDNAVQRAAKVRLTSLILHTGLMSSCLHISTNTYPKTLGYPPRGH